jgi:hypothetical protein
MSKLCQIFVCATAGEGRCGAKGGGELFEMFREEVELRGQPCSATSAPAAMRKVLSCSSTLTTSGTPA